eukprot:SAG31_NODE_1840_length_7122_cov_2.822156_4_plen_1100_part_00
MVSANSLLLPLATLLIDTEWRFHMAPEQWGNIPNVSCCASNLDGLLARVDADRSASVDGADLTRALLKTDDVGDDESLQEEEGGEEGEEEGEEEGGEEAKIRWAVTEKPPCPPPPLLGRGASECMPPDGIILTPCRPGNQACPCSGDFSALGPQFHVRDASACVVGDPNGASFDPAHRLYHLHFQNLVGINGGTTWGHVVSRDMVYWAHMPNSIWNNRAYDSADVWTGSATIVDGQVMQLYTAACRAKSAGCPCQNASTVRSKTADCNSIALAFPSDKLDMLQTNWSKLSAPVVNNTGRDPSTAWRVNGEWRITTFDQMIYGSMDFRQWYALGRQTDFPAGECPSVFELPRNTTGASGAAPAGSRMPNFVHKCSHSGRDWMQVGTYTAVVGELGRFVPTSGVNTGAAIAGEALPWRGQSFCIDVGDFGASKDFYDPVKKRRINWGTARIPPYHAQTLPREVTWHPELQQLMFGPLEELKALRGRLLANITSMVLQPGQQHSLGFWPGSVGNQSEVIARFSLPACGNATFGIGLMTKDTVPTVEAYVDYIVAGDTSHYLQHRQALRVGLRWPNGTAFGGKTATDKYTTLLPVLPGDHEIEIRIFYDNTFAEIFWMGGRAVITAAIPATKEAGYVAFARGSGEVVAKRVQAFRMKSIWVPVDEVVVGIDADRASTDGTRLRKRVNDGSSPAGLGIPTKTDDLKMDGTMMTMMTAAPPPPPPCSCSQKNLCDPLQTPLPKKEVVAFNPPTNFTSWAYWSQVTSVVLFGNSGRSSTIAWPAPQAFICFAHARNVRVVSANLPSIPCTNSTTRCFDDPVFRHRWVDELVSDVTTAAGYGTDGVSLDIEGYLAKNEYLTALTTELATKFRARVPQGQLSLCVQIWPDAYPKQIPYPATYNFGALAEQLDFLVAMGYDMYTDETWLGRDWNPHANCPFPGLVSAAQQFHTVGVPPSKLVLALPFYGYDFPCSNNSIGSFCTVPGANPRGSFCGASSLNDNCPQLQYRHVLPLLNKSVNGWQFDQRSVSVYFDYLNDTGHRRQVWFDDASTLGIKARWAKAQQFRGISMWTVDSIDYDDPNGGAAELWGALKLFGAPASAQQKSATI